jgi:hypothetical protein
MPIAPQLHQKIIPHPTGLATRNKKKTPLLKISSVVLIIDTLITIYVSIIKQNKMCVRAYF